MIAKSKVYAEHMLFMGSSKFPDENEVISAAFQLSIHVLDPVM